MRARISLQAALVVCGFAVSTSHAQSGGFVVTLGNDTVHVERFTRTGNALAGTIVTRTPATRVIKWTLTLGADGMPARYEHTTFSGDGVPLRATGMAGTITWAADSLTREVLKGTEMVTEKIPARPGMLPGPSIPYIGFTALMYELGFEYARKTADDKGASGIPQVYMIPGFVTPTGTRIWFVGSDSVEMDYFGVTRRGFKLDAQHRIIRADWTNATYKYKFARVADVNVDAIAAAWTARDKAGNAMGAMSPIDTARGTIGAANITVAYSRPARRGRVIWGDLVPWDKVWRFGADYASHITTTTDLDVGGTLVPAGRYTLWMLPSATGQTMLVVNKQVNIFGTAYNPANDFARIPMQRSPLSPIAERFTVAIENGKLWAKWDDVAWSVAVVAK